MDSRFFRKPLGDFHVVPILNPISPVSGGIRLRDEMGKRFVSGPSDFRLYAGLNKKPVKPFYSVGYGQKPPKDIVEEKETGVRYRKKFNPITGRYELELIPE